MRSDLPREWSPDAFDFEAKLSRFPERAAAAIAGDRSRSLSTVYLDVNTDRCNHACTFCDGYYRELSASSLPWERLERLVDEMIEVGVLAVVIAGDRGEPMLHPRIADLLERLTGGGIAVGLYTNGSVLTARALRALRDVAWIRVSLDAGTPETHQRIHNYPSHRRDFARLLDNVAALCAVHADVGLSFVLDPLNVNEMELAAERLLPLGPRFIEYKPKYLPQYEVDAAFVMEHREQILSALTRARARWGERVVVNNQVQGLLAEGRAPSLRTTPRLCRTSRLRLVISTHGCYTCTPFRGELVRRLGSILDQTLQELLRAASPSGIDELPCDRLCAYHQQNQRLLDLEAGGVLSACASSPPSRQDLFL